jgi:prolyl-tRNA synthetase
LRPEGQPAPASAELEKISTPNARSIADLAALLKIRPEQTLKTLIVDGENGPVALILRGDHELNAIKAGKLPGVSQPLTMADPTGIQEATGCAPGFAGPVGLDIPVFFDHATRIMSDFVCGANEVDKHLTGVNFGRDLDLPDTVDIRNVVAGDPSPGGKGTLSIARGIEVGHIFQLGSMYSEKMGATIQDADGKDIAMPMGCYGIGITRIVGAAIEQNHDDRGIIWPDPMTPFDVVLIPINMHRSDKLREAAEALYAELIDTGVDVLFDDRDARPGVKFADAELIGVPHRLVISDRGLLTGELEYRHRRDEDARMIKRDDVLNVLTGSSLS